EHAHAKTDGAAGDRLANCAIANDAESSAPDVAPEHQAWGTYAPSPGADEAIAFGHAPRRREHQGKGEIGGSFAKHARSVADRDLHAGGGAEVNIVNADREITDNGEARG